MIDEVRIQRIEQLVNNMNERLKKLEYFYTMMGYDKRYEKNLIQVTDNG